MSFPRRFFCLLMLLGILMMPRRKRRCSAQEDPPYPVETSWPTADMDPYPGFASPTAGDVLPSPTEITPLAPATDSPGSLPSATRSAATLTPGTAGTPVRDLFGTEEAEMGGARVTLPPSHTPSPTPTPSLTASHTPLPAPGQGFKMQPAWFLAGVGMPLALFFLFFLFERARRSGEFR